MLDQNTDRMWYVIGAVLVGAAIILIANNTIPEIFASVTDSFQNVSITGINSINSKSNNLLNPYGYTSHFFLNENNGNIRADDGGEYYAVTDFFEVEGGKNYLFTAPGITVNKRVSYYDSGRNHIKGSRTGPILTTEHRSKSPNNAVYARVSTSFKKYDSTEHYAPVNTWWFGEEEYDPGYH